MIILIVLERYFVWRIGGGWVMEEGKRKREEYSDSEQRSRSRCAGGGGWRRRRPRCGPRTAPWRWPRARPWAGAPPWTPRTSCSARARPSSPRACVLSSTCSRHSACMRRRPLRRRRRRRRGRRPLSIWIIRSRISRWLRLSMYRSCQGLQFSSWRLLPLATPFVWMITAVRNVTASGVLTKIKQKFTNRNFNSNGETNRIGNGDRSGKKIIYQGCLRNVSILSSQMFWIIRYQEIRRKWRNIYKNAWGFWIIIWKNISITVKGHNYWPFNTYHNAAHVSKISWEREKINYTSGTWTCVTGMNKYNNVF